MKKLLFVVASLMGLISCQSAYRVDADHFPLELKKSLDVKLESVDGTNYQFSDIYSEHTATVVIFWQSSCPCVIRYQDRINKLFDRYSNAGIAMMYVSSNSDETFEKAQSVYEKRNQLLPLMRDHNGHLAKLLRAKTTPTAALINQQGELLYLGWIDNERYPHETGRIAYLENAINELLEKQPIKSPTSPMFGCAIR